MRDLFEKLDYDNIGVVKSYDVYLADLTSEAKNIIHAILNSNNDEAGENFKAYSFDVFKSTVLASKEFNQFFNLKLN